MNALWHSNFMIKLRSWEYWPWYIIYIPIAFYWLWLSIRARSFFFFTATNPGMRCGGLLGESKKKILEMLPEKFVPVTLLYGPGVDFKQILDHMATEGITFPVIAKPDIGERGTLVAKIETTEQLKSYVGSASFKFQLQEYVQGPIELGIFYYRFPCSHTGVITSIVKKQMLQVIGDGKSTLHELIIKNDRAKLQLEELEVQMDLSDVIPKNVSRELVSIGNHCKGTTFLNGNDLITTELVNVFDQIYNEMNGFFYGRFDIRCETLGDLYEGNFKIMELNGAAAEPAHIYHPGFSIFKAYRVLFHHWKKMYEIAMANHKSGIPFLKQSIGWPMVGEHFRKDKYTSGQLA